MARLEERIEVDAPADTAWDCLHTLERYPEFVDGLRLARPEGRHRARLSLDAGGASCECEAEIADRAQGRLMIWQTTRGPRLAGAFSVQPIDEVHSRVQVRVDYDPAEVREAFGGPHGFAQSDAIQRLVRGDLQRFKELVEQQG